MTPVNDLNLAQGSFWEGLILRMRGKRNRLALWDPVRAVPRGTLRVNPTLNSTVSEGARSASIRGVAGATLLTGDWVQLGDGLGTSHLVKLVEDATMNGSGDATINFEPAVRVGLSVSAGQVCRVIRARAYFALVDSAPGWGYKTNAPLQEFEQFNLLEQFA